MPLTSKMHYVTKSTAEVETFAPRTQAAEKDPVKVSALVSGVAWVGAAGETFRKCRPPPKKKYI